MSFRNYYDSPSFGRSRDGGRGASVAERPTSVTAKYSSITPSYKSSSIPVLSPKDEAPSPITAIANRYANYKATTKKDFEKPTASKYDKKDYLDKPVSKYEKKSYEKPISKFEKKDYIDKTSSKYDKLTIPTLSTSRSRDVSPISTSSKYSLSRPSRQLSPERRAKNYKDKSRDPSPADREKDIPTKTDKSTGYSSLSSYKLYPRSSNYSRSASRADTKPDISVNRYAISNRLSSNYLKSPPTVSRTSVSPVNHTDTAKDSKNNTEKMASPVVSVSPTTVKEDASEPQKETPKEIVENGIEMIVEEEENETETVTVVTRHTSPTPPGSSAYVRSRRAELAKTIEKQFTRRKLRPQMVDKEIQSDRLDDPTRSSRFGSTARASTTNWSYYGPNTTNYTGYAGRYSTQYASLRDNASQSYSDRSSRSHSTERLSKDGSVSHSHSENVREVEKPVTPLNGIAETNKEIVATYEETKDDDTSEIIINVNLKLKKTNSPMVTTLAELVSPEITITNSQLPPPAPKSEGAVKTKKVKVRKSSTDSSSDSGSKKKIVKRKSKSSSSTDSDPGSDANDKAKDLKSSKPVPNSSSSSKLLNGHAKLKHSKSRESNSPESLSTLSTQSSISEDDTISKSKTNDGRTSADEVSIPTDRSPKQTSPVVSQKNENTEEAKSFLIRALAPVTNLFKMRSQESTDSKSWPENSTSDSTGKDVSNLVTETDRSSKSKNNTNNIIASNDDNLVKLKAIRHIESGERAWWMDSPSDKTNNGQSGDTRSPSDKNIPKKIRHIESGERAWWMESNSENKNEAPTLQTNSSESSDPSKLLKKYKFGEEEKPWWLDSSANIPEGVERLTPPRKSSNESEKSEKYNFFKVRHIESGEQKDWWLTSNENSSNGRAECQNSHSQTESDQKSFPLRRIRHVESGERPWWLSSNKNIPEGIEKLPTPPPQADSDSSDSEEVQAYAPPAQIPPFPLHLPDDEPLGTRRSPEGLETPKENEDYRGRASPYENSRQYMRNLYQNGPEKYVSRYTDMEDFMGGEKQGFSPYLARRAPGGALDDDECKEINPTQVRIHDSTAQMPVIKKVRGRGEVVDYRGEDQLDDGALQGYKDGDYGPYLDLDEPEREGLQNRLTEESMIRRNLSVNSKKSNELAKSALDRTEPEMKVSSGRVSCLPPIVDNKENKELSTALKRRRDRQSRQAHHITQQQELLNNSHSIFNGLFGTLNGNHNGYRDANGTNGHHNGDRNGQDDESYKTKCHLGDVLKNGNQRYTAGLKQRIQNGNLGDSVNALDALTVMRQKQIDSPEVIEDRGIIINREHSIKDLAQRLTSPVSPVTEDKPIRVSDMSGIVSKAKEELAKSQSKEVIKSPTREIAPKIHEIKISENDLHWEELKKGCLNREFHLCDLDFSDLRLDSDEDADSPASNALGIPPPPPPALICFPPPPTAFPPTKNSVPAPPPKPPLSSEFSNDSDSSNLKKNKKTVKLFWREIYENPAPVHFKSKQPGLIWDDLPEVALDTNMLEHLFEAKTNDLIIKKLMEPKRNLILDTKRSNAINIAMKKLPTPQTIKTAIMKMDATVIGREGIEKLLTMLPTEEETIKIQEAQYANPDLPLGSAEQFLLTLASISELPSRLKLWVFKLDFDNLEKEIAEPLMDLKQGIELLKVNKTFKVILSTLRSVGSFLNGSQVRGFRLEYLAKVMEVKDTVHKHPLLYHVCEMIIDKFPDSTDFFSEVGPVIRASKVDFDALTSTLHKLEADCKGSWDHLKRVAEDDSSSIFATKFNEFLTDAAERIILLSIIFKRVMCRYNKFLSYLGVPPGDVSKTKPSEFLKVIAEFALEYRTTRERVLLQQEKKANHRERNKAKKMIIDVSSYSTRNGDHSAADSALKQLLNNDAEPDNRRKSKHALTNGDFSADDEIIESLVRSATSKHRPAHSRKNRISHKKNLTRSRDWKES